MRFSRYRSGARPALFGAIILAAALPFSSALAQQFERPDPSAELMARDAATAGIVSDGPFADVIRNLEVTGRGVRLVPDATTDVWALGGYAYTGTFNSPCGGDPEAGIWIWDVSNANKPAFVSVIASPVGSRANDVKAAAMNSGDILVHSNESCSGGPGGFEIYSVDDPANPIFHAGVTVNESDRSAISPLFFTGGLQDVGVHNLFLFTQGSADYVAVVGEGVFDTFRIYDITNPTNPGLVGAWGAEEIFDPGVGDLTLATDPGGARTLAAILDLLFGGVGAAANKLLHDVTISADGTKAYLSNWDAGLVLLDISDPTDPQLVSVALDPINGSLDGEVNSHAAWPSEDGSIVVETEEDFDSSADNLENFTFGTAPTNRIPGVGISYIAGSEFEASQTGNNVTVEATRVMVNSGPLAGTAYPAEEGAGSQPKLADTGAVTGDAVWIGRACDGDVILNDGSLRGPGVAVTVAVARRGACTFAEKLINAARAGADAIVIADNNAGDPWGGVRIWDYSDPANPVLASIFDTVCSADAEDPSCDTHRGTYSVHNVIVEREGGRDKAYISWYSDGVLILDVTDPYNPVETARYHREGPGFEATNGGIQDVWGIYKEVNASRIYASDRNGGLYILKELGAGSTEVSEN